MKKYRGKGNIRSVVKDGSLTFKYEAQTALLKTQFVPRSKHFSSRL